MRARSRGFLIGKKAQAPARTAQLRNGKGAISVCEPPVGKQSDPAERSPWNNWHHWRKRGSR